MLKSSKVNSSQFQDSANRCRQKLQTEAFFSEQIHFNKLIYTVFKLLCIYVSLAASTVAFRQESHEFRNTLFIVPWAQRELNLALRQD